MLPDPSTSRAVLIGVSDYRNLSTLPAVRNNLHDLAEVLTSDRGWRLPAGNVTVLHNPSSPTDVLEALHRAADAARSGLLVYFAGHGLTDAGAELYLALPDGDQDRFHYAVRFAEVRREVTLTARSCPARVVLLDCCYSGAAMDGFMGGATGVADQAVIDGAYLMTASGRNRLAVAPVGERHTAFTGALLQSFRNGVPGGPAMMDMETLYGDVSLTLRARNLPAPQQRSRNFGHRISLGVNAAASKGDAPGPGRAVGTIIANARGAKQKPTERILAVVAALPAMRVALVRSAGGRPFLPLDVAGNVVRDGWPLLIGSDWAGAGTPTDFLATYLPEFARCILVPANNPAVPAVADPPTATSPLEPPPAPPRRPKSHAGGSAGAARRDSARERVSNAWNAPMVRLCMAADVVGYSRLSAPVALRTQERLVRALAEARAHAGVGEGDVRTQQQGDGQFCVFPGGLDDSRVIPRVVTGLVAALRDVNADLISTARIRMRLAFHRGLLRPGDNGWVGVAAIAVHRILDSAPLRAAVRDSATDLAVAISDALYRDAVEPYDELPHAQFRDVTVELPEKHFVERAWIYRCRR